MKNLTIIFCLLFLSSGLFAQSAEAINQERATDAQQMLLGEWVLKSVSGQTMLGDQAVSGSLVVRDDKTYTKVLFGDKSAGTYSLTYQDDQLLLETVEGELVSNLVLKTLTPKEFILLADGAELLFVK